MRHEGVFESIGADDRFGHGYEPHLLLLEDRSSGAGVMLAVALISVDALYASLP